MPDRRPPILPSVVRVATYTRISTDEEHQPYSLEAQTARLGAYVQSQEGWEISRRYTDQMTGSTLDRPGLQQALDDAREGGFDLLLVYRVDRFARSVRALALLLEELDRARVHFRSATEPFDTGTAAGRMMVQMLGVFAEFERATLVDRVIAGMERKAARGEWLGGHAPYGYRVQPETGALQLDEAEAGVVSMIFDLYARKKLGSRAIASRLTEQGHRSRPGKLWSHVRILGVLRNPVYTGKIAFRQNEYDGPHPRLVELEVFEAAQRLLRLRGEDGSKRRSNTTEYLLSGLVRCARCGHRYIGTAAHGRNGRYRYYTCFARNRHGRSGCTADVLPADELDRAVIEGLLETYADVNLIDRLRARLQGMEAAAQPKTRSEMETVDAEISQAEAGVDRYYSAFELGRLPEGRFAKRIEALEQRLTDLRARRKALEEAEATRPEVPAAAVIHDTAEAIAEAMNRGTLQQRKALLQQLVAGVEVNSREEIVPTFRIPATTVRVMDRMVGGPGLEPG